MSPMPLYPILYCDLFHQRLCYLLVCVLASVLIFSPLLHPLWHALYVRDVVVDEAGRFNKSPSGCFTPIYISAAHFKVKERVRELPCLSSLTTLLRISIWHLRQSRNGERDISHHVSNVVLGWREGNYRESKADPIKRIDFCVRETPFFLQPPSSSYICWYLVTLTVMDIWFLIDFLTVRLEIFKMTQFHVLYRDIVYQQHKLSNNSLLLDTLQCIALGCLIDRMILLSSLS